VDGNQFDEFVRRALEDASRRGVLRRGLGAVVASAAAAWGLRTVDSAAAKKKKRKKAKKKGVPKRAPTVPPGCPAGTQSCGAACCPAGQVCGNPATGACVTGQGTCAAGADTCGGGTLITCDGNPTCVCAQATDGTTRCAITIAEIARDDCGGCATDADCRAAFPNVVGAFCVKDAKGPVCLCDPGQNLCAAPCPS
jgi:hypothetical protein